MQPGGRKPDSNTAERVPKSERNTRVEDTTIIRPRRYTRTYPRIHYPRVSVLTHLQREALLDGRADGHARGDADGLADVGHRGKEEEVPVGGDFVMIGWVSGGWRCRLLLLPRSCPPEQKKRQGNGLRALSSLILSENLSRAQHTRPPAPVREAPRDSKPTPHTTHRHTPHATTSPWEQRREHLHARARVVHEAAAEARALHVRVERLAELGGNLRVQAGRWVGTRVTGISTETLGWRYEGQIYG